MRAVVQRVLSSSVKVAGEIVGEIGNGLLVLVGVEQSDEPADAKYVADKIVGLRIFADDQGKMNLSVVESGGEVLVVSQFTLLGDVRKGRRPSFVHAASQELGNELYLLCAEKIREQGLNVETGRFQADMKVELINDGPVTILIDSRKQF